MADLVIVTFDDEERARVGYREAVRLDDRAVVPLDGIAFVHVDEHGTTHVEAPGRESRLGTRAASSAVFGTVVGFLFFVPFLGLVAGGAVGALFAGLDRAGVDAAFRKHVANDLARGGSAIIVYAAHLDGDRFAGAMEQFGGTVRRTPLSEQAERDLARDFSEPS